MTMALPHSFTNHLVCESENIINIRSSIRSLEDINKWVKEYESRKTAQTEKCPPEKCPQENCPHGNLPKFWRHQGEEVFRGHPQKMIRFERRDEGCWIGVWGVGRGLILEVGRPRVTLYSSNTMERIYSTRVILSWKLPDVFLASLQSFITTNPSRNSKLKSSD